MGLKEIRGVTDLQQNLEGRPYSRLEVLENSIAASQHMGRNTLTVTQNPEGRDKAQAQEPSSNLHSLSLLCWQSFL